MVVTVRVSQVSQVGIGVVVDYGSVKVRSNCVTPPMLDVI